MQTQLEASRPSSSIKINQQEVRGHSFISTLYLAQYFAHCVPNTYIYTYIHTYNAHICIYSIRMNKYCVYVCGNVHGRKNKEKVALRCRLEEERGKASTQKLAFSLCLFLLLFSPTSLAEHQNFILWNTFTSYDLYS